MNCPRHDNNAVARAAPNAPLVPNRFADRWHRLWCGECRREHLATQRMAHSLEQMRTETLPETSLNRMLTALGLPSLAELTPAARARMKAQLRHLLLLIGLILFVTTLAQPELIGREAIEATWFGKMTPNALQTAGLWLLLGLGWYVKPVFAVLMQSVFRFPNARRGWLTAGAAGAAVCWLLLRVTQAHAGLMALLIGLGALLALASTVMGGILVEQGQRLGATGRLGALHAAGIFLARLSGAGIVGLMGAQTLHWIAPFCAVLLAGFALLCWRLLRDPQPVTFDGVTPTAEILNTEVFNTGTRNASAAGPDISASPRVVRHSLKQTWRDILASFRALLLSKNVWGAAGIALLVYIAPNFTSLQSQENARLGFSVAMQNGLDFVGGACGLVGVGGYLVLCRRVSLQTLLYAGIACNSIGTFLYLGYRSPLTAFLIEGANGLLSALVFAMLFDLAIRAIPRGQAMLGYAFLTSVIVFASRLSNLFGSWLSVQAGWHFAHVVSLSAFLSLPALAVVAFLPASLLDRREGRITEPELARTPSGTGVPSYG